MTQFDPGKWPDGFTSVGPWLVTSDRVPDPDHLRLTTRLNGGTRQDWTTRGMISDCCKLIAECSSIMALQPGDILFTGTPQGVIFGEKAPAGHRRWLRAGGEIVSWVEGLGDLMVKLV